MKPFSARRPLPTAAAALLRHGTLTLLFSPLIAFAWAGEMARPSLSLPSGFARREAVMKVLGDEKFRFAGGSFINAASTLRYDGDVLLLNAFLARLSACEGVKLSVSFSDGNAPGLIVSEKIEEAEGEKAAWSLYHNGWGDPRAIHITVNTRRVREADVTLPKPSCGPGTADNPGR